MRVPLLLLLTASVAYADGDLERGTFTPPGSRPAENARGTFSATPFLRREGALAGKTIYVSAGHGWYWSASLGRWTTQRGNTHDLVEDFISAETVSQELIPILHDMGAYVVPVREASMQRELAITDDADAGFTTTGDVTAIAEGWSRPPDPIPDARNPFADGGSVTLGPGASATWAIDVPADGDYEVYVAWVQGADRAADARYVIHHAGGTTERALDQRRHGGTWVLLGTLHFSPGAPASIELHNDGPDIVSADAVRIGGGYGHFDRGGGAIDRPAFESAARYAAQWNGAPSTVWDYAAEDNNDDVGTRSRFSAWEHEDGEDAVYVAWHTNAPSPARGTSSFAYGPDAFGDLSQFTGVPGSLELMDAIHTELVEDLRAAWEPGWQDRQQHTAYFGEVNPSHNPEMPATLIEVAFHDTLEDAEALRDPRFRRLAARAFAQGIAKYFATRDGTTLTLPPEPPAAVRAIGGELAWDAPDADPAGGDPATGYRVYLSHDGRAFDDGTVVSGTTFALPDDERPWIARVTATNAGGESRPSPAVGAHGAGRVLVVAGFTRLDGTMLFHEDLSAYDLATIDRAYLDRINDESHAGRHVLSIVGAGYSVDVATVSAVRRGLVDLTAYEAVDWAAGEELTPLDDTDQAKLLAYVDGGGALIVGGTEVAAALAGTTLLGRLGATLIFDSAGAYAATGAPGTAFEGFELTFDDAGPGGYDADGADALGGIHALTYPDGTNAAAVLGVRTLLLGFPVETVAGAEARAELMRRALAALGVPPDEPDPPPGDPAGCCGAGGGAASPVPLALLLCCVPHDRRHRRRSRGGREHDPGVHQAGPARRQEADEQARAAPAA